MSSPRQWPRQRHAHKMQPRRPSTRPHATWLLEDLEEAGRAHATAHAHRDDCGLCAASLALKERVAHLPAAGHAKRVADADRAGPGLGAVLDLERSWSGKSKRGKIIRMDVSTGPPGQPIVDGLAC